MTESAQAVKRKPGRPPVTLTEDQKKAVTLAELHYKEYRRVQRLAREEVRRMIANHRASAAEFARRALDAGVSLHYLSKEVANSGDTTAMKNLIKEGESQ